PPRPCGSPRPPGAGGVPALPEGGGFWATSDPDRNATAMAAVRAFERSIGPPGSGMQSGVRIGSREPSPALRAAPAGRTLVPTLAERLHGASAGLLSAAG